MTDALADLLWTPSSDADANLLAEGVDAARIERVGNIMIDSYEMLRSRIEAAHARERFALARKQYGLITLHRPANVDDAAALREVLTGLAAVARDIPLIFPIHPRTRERIRSFGLEALVASEVGVHVTPPLGYIEFMSLVSDAALLITDSGGVQEETTYLGIPCLTMRTTTERPITITEGTNALVRVEELYPTVRRVLDGQWQKGTVPALWDGHTADRVAASLKAHCKQ